MVKLTGLSKSNSLVIHKISFGGVFNPKSCSAKLFPLASTISMWRTFRILPQILEVFEVGMFYHYKCVKVFDLVPMLFLYLQLCIIPKPKGKDIEFGHCSSHDSRHCLTLFFQLIWTSVDG